MRKPSDGSFQRSLAPAAWAVLVLATGAAPPADGPAFAVPNEVLAVLAAHCADCHGDRGKGNVDVTALDKLKPGDRLETLNKIQDQLFYKMMPPPSADQPGAKDARVLGEWVRAELRRHEASKLDDRLPYPDAGNYVDHVALFDGSSTDKPFTPPAAGSSARRSLRSACSTCSNWRARSGTSCGAPASTALPADSRKCENSLFSQTVGSANFQNWHQSSL